MPITNIIDLDGIEPEHLEYLIRWDPQFPTGAEPIFVEASIASIIWMVDKGYYRLALDLDTLSVARACTVPSFLADLLFKVRVEELLAELDAKQRLLDTIYPNNTHVN